MSPRGGYAREDAPDADAIGVYTDPKVAKTVAACAGFGARVVPLALNHIPPGLRAHAEALGMTLPPEPQSLNQE